MPAVNGAHMPPSSSSEPRPYFVLVTGFGPFSRYAVNPSWLAVQPLHNAIIHVEVPADSVTLNDPQNPPSSIPLSDHTTTLREIRITTLNVPVTYEDVLSVAPGLHARPPSPSPRVAGRGPLRIERVSHKFGYNMKDANGCHAPVVRVAREEVIRGPSEPSPEERMERARLGYTIEGPIDGTEPPKRGFGKGYESFPEEIYTDVDVEKLVNHLKTSGVEVSVLVSIRNVTL
ncbi:hypothetical protein JVT61DRAFT_7786 [Boletus reticuloceps]|uniref:Pyroglutamyl-peptidase I n=1 Tax=Boletus reticuloceps TaxID=495285 RepID=A0A8I3A5W4_9AGAM|nr:hypothetical protein JVT61DRAFT_7786 [Boletus reticuloceps]